jgi:mannitol 2-dehydrogenase
MSNTAFKKQDLQTLSNELLSSRCPSSVQFPHYDRSKIKSGIVHLGVGGFHRAHQALYIEELLERGLADTWAIYGVGIMPQDEAMNKALSKQDFLYTLVERSGEKDTARIIGSIINHVHGYKNPEAVLAKMASAETNIVSLTATEGGYCFNQCTGEFNEAHPGVQNDLKNPLNPHTIFGYLSEALDRRRKAGVKPFTVLSCDNLQGNGHVAKKMLLAFSELRDAKLASWVSENVAFPNTMVDRITPATTDTELALVRDEFGIIDAFPVVSESFRQWVIEDEFCAGRPAFEEVGAQFTTDVAPYERMKIRLLNATHSAMGYLGYLCGHRYIHDVAHDKEFDTYLRAMMDSEVTPVVGAVKGVNLADYKASVLARFANPHIKDQVLRICLDGSAKIPKFIIPSITDQLAQGGPITNLTLCVASWMRFLNGVDEQGSEIPINDPEGQRLQEAAKRGGSDPMALLSLTDIFGSLGKSEKFVSEIKPLLKSLYEQGARATLRSVIN